MPTCRPRPMHGPMAPARRRLWSTALEVPLRPPAPSRGKTRHRARRRSRLLRPRRDQRHAGTLQCRRLHHARGSSGAPALGQLRRHTITTAASPMRHELALPARVPRAPQQRSVEARPAALRAFERQTPLVVGGGGVGGSSKKNRRQASQNLAGSMLKLWMMQRGLGFVCFAAPTRRQGFCPRPGAFVLN